MTQPLRVLVRGGGPGTVAALRDAGFAVDTAGTAAILPHLVIVDTTAACQQLRTAGDATPILLISHDDTVADRVAGFDAGADDYLVAPFATAELLARVRALLRRAAPQVVRVGPLTAETRSRGVTCDGRPLDLTATEYTLLLVLMQHHDQVLTRSRLFELVWGYDLHGTSNTLDVYIGYLRRKLTAANVPDLLHTVRGVGYMLRSQPPSR